MRMNSRRTRVAGVTVTLFLAGLPLVAQTRDYSRSALFEIFVAPAPAPTQGFTTNGASIEYRTGSTVLRFLPVLLPMAGTEPGHTPMPSIDPFALTGTVFPDTRETISRLTGPQDTADWTMREKWQLWRTRREVEAILRTLR